MVDFGFSSYKSRFIDLDKVDTKLPTELFKEDEILRACIGCGGCSGACTAAQFTNFNFRLLHTLIRRGEYKEAKQEAEKCMLCGKCYMTCPRGINTRKIIQAIKRIF